MHALSTGNTLFQSGECGQMLNLHDIAGDVGVSDDTAKRWMK